MNTQALHIDGVPSLPYLTSGVYREGGRLLLLVPRISGSRDQGYPRARDCNTFRTVDLLHIAIALYTEQKMEDELPPENSSSLPDVEMKDITPLDQWMENFSQSSPGRGKRELVTIIENRLRELGKITIEPGRRPSPARALFQEPQN